MCDCNCKRGEKGEVEQRILDLAMGHAAFEHSGHQTAIEMCRQVAERCAGDYSNANILKVMDSMVRIETEEEKARRKAWNDRATAELAADLAQFV